MGEAATSTGSEATEETPIHHLPQETITDILLRLPAKSILCCRTVCKAWHSITTDLGFLAAHARRQSTEVVLYTDQAVKPGRGHAVSVDIALDVLPVSPDEEKEGQRRLIRYPKEYRQKGSCLLLSSCNGVLLFKRDEGCYVLCNPATRQWAYLPLLAHRHYRYVYEYVFYFHQTSDTYKLLCHVGHLSKIWFILSTGAAEPQQIGEDVHKEAYTSRIPDLLAASPVDLHGRLHWSPYRQTSNTDETPEMVVFESEAETFHRMAGPPRANLVKLFSMAGLLAAADFGVENHIDLWFLEDYVAGRWECRHHVAIPCDPEIRRLLMPRDHSWLFHGAAAADSEGNVMLGKTRCLAVYNVRNKMARAVDSSVATPQEQDNVVVSRHVFRENMVPHPHSSMGGPLVSCSSATYGTRFFNIFSVVS